MKNYIEWVIAEDDINFSSELRKKYNKIKKSVTGEVYQIDWNDKANHDLYKKISERKVAPEDKASKAESQANVASIMSKIFEEKAK
jgi:hypothetical protein